MALLAKSRLFRPKAGFSGQSRPEPLSGKGAPEPCRAPERVGRQGCPSQAPWAWLALARLDLDAIQHLPRIDLGPV